jgi:hypothetical protein
MNISGGNNLYEIAQYRKDSQKLNVFYELFRHKGVMAYFLVELTVTGIVNLDMFKKFFMAIF